MSTRKRYTKEFKLEAVRLLEQGDRTAAELARELVRAMGSGLTFDISFGWRYSANYRDGGAEQSGTCQT